MLKITELNNITFFSKFVKTLDYLGSLYLFSEVVEAPYCPILCSVEVFG